MLQINKKSILLKVKYNLQFLTWNKIIANKYLTKKSISNLITLRSPKHFNIGKNKFNSLNYKTKKLYIQFNGKIRTSSIINSTKFLYTCFKKKILLTPTISINSLKITVKTLFKLMWLETLFFF